ncbi:hypothetical protein CEXT_634651 [Caerostris extrusa]|uniref:Uncharacterized protein n=1 Tax=Caerostris extrusa TaxID=172846 RepID=A0AAV4RSS9_CAEEX|nr:hypothetical protein CEXT_634651 [Caerostris extrusa]
MGEANDLISVGGVLCWHCIEIREILWELLSSAVELPDFCHTTNNMDCSSMRDTYGSRVLTCVHANKSELIYVQAKIIAICAIVQLHWKDSKHAIFEFFSLRNVVYNPERE